MSDKQAKLSPQQIDAAGDSLARRAETSSLSAVNDELAQIRSGNPRDYRAIVEAMERNNGQHVRADQKAVKEHNDSRWFFQSAAENHVPTLIIEDRSKGKSAPDYRVVGAIVADSPRAAQPNTEGENPAQKKEPGLGRGPETGSKSRSKSDSESDSMPYFAAMNEAVALREADKVLNPSANTRTK